MRKIVYFIIIMFVISLNFCINIFADENIEYEPTDFYDCYSSKGYIFNVGGDPQVKFSDINIKTDNLKGFLIELESEDIRYSTIEVFWKDEVSEYSEENKVSFRTKTNVFKYYVPIKKMKDLDNDLEYIKSIRIDPNLRKAFKIKLIAIFDENEEILNYDISISKDKIDIIINEAFQKLFSDKPFILFYCILLVFMLLIIFKINKILKVIKSN